MLDGYRLPQRTRTICRLLKWTTLLVALIFTYFYFAYDGADSISDYHWNELSDEAKAAVKVYAGKTRAIWALATITWFLPLLFLLAAWRVFAAFQTGDVFSLSVVKAIRFLGIVTLFETLFRVFLPSLMTLLITFDSSDGHRLLIFSISTNQLVKFLLGALFLIIGHIFTQAVRISDENRQIV